MAPSTTSRHLHSEAQAETYKQNFCNNPSPHTNTDTHTLQCCIWQSSTSKGQEQSSTLWQKPCQSMTILLESIISILSTVYPCVPLCFYGWSGRWQCMFMSIILLSIILTNVFALHVVVEGDTVWDSARALGTPDWGHIKKRGQQTSLVPLNTWPRCFDVHVVAWNRQDNNPDKEFTLYFHFFSIYHCSYNAKWQY